MGALKGSVSVRRYLVRGEPPRDKARIVKGIRAHALVPIDPRSDVERSVGWASIEDPELVDLSSEEIFTGDCVALALRVDTLKPPAAVVKRLVLEKLRALGRKPNRAEKTAMKAEITKQLRGRYYPVVRTVDLVWQMDAGRVFFWSHAKGTNELAVDLFAKSFGLELVPCGPGLVAGRGTIPPSLEPTPELIVGFPGLPGRLMVEDTDVA
jgi:recombination associated protein RdgC